MARAHFVAKARTDHPEGGIKKGESYYWWAFMVGGRGGPKHYSKTPPRRSQLTQSEFYSALYEIEDSLNALPADDGLGDAVASIVSDLENLAEETRTKKENMPDGLQEGGIGQMLEERADACQGAADELGAITFEIEDKEDGQSEDDFWQEKLDEVQGVSIDAP